MIRTDKEKTGRERIMMFDCGCVVTRPRDSRYYAARWKVYTTVNYIILKCLDCGKIRRFEMKRPGPQIVQYEPDAEITLAEE